MLVEVLIPIAAVMAIVALTLGLVRGLDSPASPGNHHRWLTGWKIWHVLTAILLIMLLWAGVASRHEGGVPVFLAFLLLVALFLRAWRHEFLFLMSIRDDELPGQFDKIIWVVMLTLFAPVGYWCFRQYRLAHWPEPESVKAHPASDLA